MSDFNIKDSAKSMALATSDSIKCHRLAMDPEQNFVSVFFTFEGSNVPAFNITVYHLIIILTEGYIRIIFSFQPQELHVSKSFSMSFLQNSI